MNGFIAAALLYYPSIQANLHSHNADLLNIKVLGELYIMALVYWDQPLKPAPLRTLPHDCVNMVPIIPDFLLKIQNELISLIFA